MSVQAGHDNSADPDARDTLWLVDGSGFIFRAYYALPQNLTNPEGTPVGAVLGFSNMLLKLLQDFHAPYVAVVFDAARENFRNAIYPDYKANRDETPEDLIPQFPLIREATQAFDIPALELEGYEADDLIASYAEQARQKRLKVVIVGSDKDLYQLINTDVQLYDPIKQTFIGPEEVAEKFHVPPDKVVEVQALAGDSTDNVPGVPGIGIKTAARLINDYGDVDTLLARLDEITKPKQRENLQNHADDARISRQLVTLARDVELPAGLDALKTRDPANDKLIDFLRAQNFKSLLARVQRDGSGGTGGAFAEDDAPDPVRQLPPIDQNSYHLITDSDTLQAWADSAREHGILAIDTETTHLTPAKARLVGISICIKPGAAGYIPVGHGGAAPEIDLFGQESDTLERDNESEQLDIATVIDSLAPVLTDPGVLKVGQNIKYDLQILQAVGAEIRAVDDTMLLSYVLDSTEHGHSMDELCRLHFDHKPIAYKEIAGTGKSQKRFDQLSIQDCVDYAAEDAEITRRLHHVLKPRIPAEHMARVYEDIERPLIPVIADMEAAGIKIDAGILRDMSRDFGEKLAALEKDIHTLAGREFNVGSPKQIGEVLFDELGLKGGKKTKTGDWSTSADLLEKLADEGYEIVAKILEWRQLSKLKSTYTDALQGELNPVTGRVHTSFSMSVTATGRLSSSDPNLQNIPIRTEDGRKIRTAFIADEGYKIMSIDYSQVELRLAAHMADIPGLKQAFREGRDIHSATASQVFGIPEDELTHETRRQAKAINFGIIYGISGWGLAKQLGCSAEEANAYIHAYFKQFPELSDYMQTRKAEARDNGFVQTLFGRKCAIAGIRDKNPSKRQFAERQAINAPLQGTAADIMKLAMIRVGPALQQEELSARLLLQVHDELLLEVPDEEIETTADCVKRVMAGVAELDVPLEAEAGWGQSWAEAH